MILLTRGNDWLIAGEGGDGHLKIRQAMLRRQDLIDKIRVSKICLFVFLFIYLFLR